MIDAVRSHREIAADIQRFIEEEQFSKAQELLGAFARAVIEACNSSGKEQEFQQAREFLRSAVIATKARRAHYLEDLRGIEGQRGYLSSLPVDRKRKVDVSG